jgi:hypothetical protein
VAFWITVAVGWPWAGQVVRGGAGAEGGQQGDADGAADLLGGIDQGAGDAAVGGVDRAVARLVAAGKISPEPIPTSEGGQDDRGVAGAGAQDGEPEQVADGQEHPGRDGDLRPGKARQDAQRQGGAGEGAADNGEDGQAGLDRGVVQGLLQVVGEEQEDGEAAASPGASPAPRRAA